MRSAIALPLVLGLALTGNTARADDLVQQVSQYGITWTFDRPVRAGQFVTGDWWVIGPVTVTSVNPGPGPADLREKIATPKNRYGDTSLRNDSRWRNGSMIVLRPGSRHGYDSRSRSYDPELSVTFPLTIKPNRSLISTSSHPTVPVDNFAARIMWAAEKKLYVVVRAAAVLTVLAAAPPADAFRPPYAGTDKPLYRASQLDWNLLQALRAPSVDHKAAPPGYELKLPDDWEAMERYFQRPWLDHLNDWPVRAISPTENNPNYGREIGRLVSLASLMLNLDVPRVRKEKLLRGLVQYGLDLSGIAKAGGSWNWGGGHSSGRKWPVLFASLMLNAPEVRQVSDRTIFQEDSQTYYGTGAYGQTALYWMVIHHGIMDRYEERLPQDWKEWDVVSERYRVNTSAVAWVGTALAVRLMRLIQIWDHDAFFDYCDRWMEPTDSYAALRGSRPRPRQEGKTLDPFVDAMWRTYRASSPDQPLAGHPRMLVPEGRGFKWVANPKPTPEAIAEHLARLQAK